MEKEIHDKLVELYQQMKAATREAIVALRHGLIAEAVNAQGVALHCEREMSALRCKLFESRTVQLQKPAYELVSKAEVA